MKDPAPEKIRVARLRPGSASEVRELAPVFDHAPRVGAAREFLADDRVVFLLARVDGTAAGYLWGHALTQPHTRRRQMFLYDVAVAPPFRRRGVGRALVEALLDHCRRRRFEEMFVFTDDPDNAAAHGLYRVTGGATETVGDRMYVYRFSRPPAGRRRR